MPPLREHVPLVNSHAVPKALHLDAQQLEQTGEVMRVGEISPKFNGQEALENRRSRRDRGMMIAPMNSTATAETYV